MKILDDIKLDFTDVLLIPKRNEYTSRSEAILERTFKFKYSPYEWTGVPIMVSNMDSTGTIEMAKALQKHKIITCLHKYYKSSDIPPDLDKNYYAVSSGSLSQAPDSSGSASGTSPTGSRWIREADLLNLDEIMKNVNPKIICLDVANGYMNKFIKICKSVRDKYPEKIIIAGNVCTSEGALDLVMNGGADIVKVGIGSGSCCTAAPSRACPGCGAAGVWSLRKTPTRKQTGIGMPQLSANMECSDTAHGIIRSFVAPDSSGSASDQALLGPAGIGAHIISDGGIQRGPGELARMRTRWNQERRRSGWFQVIGDISKAYAAGADFLMCGSMFAGHEESGGETISEGSTIYKIFYGMSSTTAMNKYSGGVAKYRSSEGKTVKLKYRGNIENTVLDILGGVQRLPVGLVPDAEPLDLPKVVGACERLRSTMTYIGSSKVKDIPKCATFIRVNRQLNQIYNGNEI